MNILVRMCETEFLVVEIFCNASLKINHRQFEYCISAGGDVATKCRQLSALAGPIKAQKLATCIAQRSALR